MRTTRSLAADVSRSYWDGETAQRVLEAWREEGTTLAEFARKYGVTAQRLSWWRKRLDKRVPGMELAPLSFLPAEVTASAAVVVRLPGGVVVEAAGAEAVAPGWIAALARELAAS